MGDVRRINGHDIKDATARAEINALDNKVSTIESNIDTLSEELKVFKDLFKVDLIKNGNFENYNSSTQSFPEWFYGLSEGATQALGVYEGAEANTIKCDNSGALRQVIIEDTSSYTGKTALLLHFDYIKAINHISGENINITIKYVDGSGMSESKVITLNGGQVYRNYEIEMPDMNALSGEISLIMSWLNQGGSELEVTLGGVKLTYFNF